MEYIYINLSPQPTCSISEHKSEILQLSWRGSWPKNNIKLVFFLVTWSIYLANTKQQAAVFCIDAHVKKCGLLGKVGNLPNPPEWQIERLVPAMAICQEHSKGTSSYAWSSDRVGRQSFINAWMCLFSKKGEIVKTCQIIAARESSRISRYCLKCQTNPQ